ncbi:MAG: hypothetical protein JSV03_16095 [Planctomycetota bacterium]|nr:MAG: hypothetical protein JSV03_16095 [Planctomycetota bacterium]
MRSVAILGIDLMLISGIGCVASVQVGTNVEHTTIRRTKAGVIPVNDVSRATLKLYKTIQLGRVTADVDKLCPNECLTCIRKAMREAFADELDDAFPGGGRKLVVDIVCRFFKDTGNEGRLDLLVTLVDGRSKKELGKLYVEGVSDTDRVHKAGKLADETAEELTEYLKGRKEGD